MKIMAIDYGDARTGVAFSDPGGTLAGYRLTIHQGSWGPLTEEIKKLYIAENAQRAVLGLPKNMDGSEGPRALKTRQFGDALAKKLGVDIVYWDERGSSVTAGRALSDMGQKRGRQRAKIDAVAAAVILQNYLDFLNRGAR